MTDLDNVPEKGQIVDLLDKVLKTAVDRVGS